MYGFWRLGVRPEPSTGAADRANGLATKVSTNAKKVAIPPRTGTVQGRSWRMRLRLSATAAEPSAVRTSSQSRSEPSWPPQNAVNEYGNGSLRLEWSATYVIEKSRVLKALRRTRAATAVAAKTPTSALRADSCRRRRLRCAARLPATAA